MDSLSMMNQAQSAYQNAQSQSAISRMSAAGDQPNFAALTAEQLRDPSLAKALQMKKIRETAVDFEATFLSQMLQPMFEGIELDEPFGGGHAEKMWQGMLVNEYGKALARSGGIGLADEVQKQLLRAQEGL